MVFFFLKWIDSSICFKKKNITEKLLVVEISMPRNKHLWCWSKWVNWQISLQRFLIYSVGDQLDVGD